MEKDLIKKIMASMKCGVCGQHYMVDNIKVLGHHEDLWFLRAFCLACNTQFLVAAVIREGKAPEIITDLTKAELHKFNNIDVPTTDDMLDMHNFLKEFDGDFSQTFNQQ